MVRPRVEHREKMSSDLTDVPAVPVAVAASVTDSETEPREDASRLARIQARAAAILEEEEREARDLAKRIQAVKMLAAPQSQPQPQLQPQPPLLQPQLPSTPRRAAAPFPRPATTYRPRHSIPTPTPPPPPPQQPRQTSRRAQRGFGYFDNGDGYGDGYGDCTDDGWSSDCSSDRYTSSFPCGINCRCARCCPRVRRRRLPVRRRDCFPPSCFPSYAPLTSCAYGYCSWLPSACTTYVSPSCVYPVLPSLPVPVSVPTVSALGTSTDTVCSANGCYTVQQNAVTSCSPFGCTTTPVGPPNLASVSDRCLF